MEQQLLQTGEETISKLAGRAAEVQGLVSANFAAKSLADVQASFEAAFASGAPGAVNPEVVKVHTIVREQAAQAVEDLKAVEMWLQIKTPEIADGNNFGVEVQAFVAGELKAMRTEMLGLVDGLSAYHLLRGTTVEKMTKAPSKSTDEETKVAVEGDKTTNSSTKTTKTSASESAPLPDYVKYIAALDAKEYHACYSKLVDVRNTYVKANLALSKNSKKLNDPRGEGDGSGQNYSSMF